MNDSEIKERTRELLLSSLQPVRLAPSRPGIPAQGWLILAIMVAIWAAAVTALSRLGEVFQTLKSSL